MREPLAGSFVVGTAGHIDHGKSALVKALTQIDPDRLDEEKRRGMTIDLGFAYLDLSSGRRVGIVDVPGHQRFLKNMLAGVHGMDAVLLVIAADEGPMPQTREHLAIVDLLGIEHGVAVLTKADLVDAAWLALVRDEVMALLAPTSMHGVPVVAVSSVTASGLDDLRVLLDDELAKTSPRPDLGRPRLPVDRSFAMSGFGTVITGTLVGGRLRVGTEVAVLPGGRRVRIRGLQQHNRPVDEASPGSRTAVNLSGVDRSQVRRGDVLGLPGSLPATRRLDARLAVLASAPHPLAHRQRLLMYHETTEVIVELSLLEADELRPGREGWAQLYLEEPVVALAGDRFILRVPSPATTVAGGVILDSQPRRHRRRDPGVLTELESRRRADPVAGLVLELGKHPFGLPEHELSRRFGLSAPGLAELLQPLIDSGLVRQLGTVLLGREQYTRMVTRLTDCLDTFHRAQPLRRGMPREELRSRTGIPADLFGPLVESMVAEGTVADHAGEVASVGHRQALSHEQDSAVRAFLSDLEAQPFTPPPLTELTRRHQLTASLLQYLVANGQVVRLNDETAFARSAYEEAVGRLRAYLIEHGTLTVAAARDVLGSSRRYVLPLLEWLDAQKITRRVGDDRILRG